MQELELQELMLRPQVSFDKIKSELETHLQQYKDIIVTEDNAFEIQREVASVRRRIDEERKRIKKEFQKPLKEFEKRVKELQKMVEEVETPIKEILDQSEEKRKKEKIKLINGMIKSVAREDNLDEKYVPEIEIDQKWLNKTTTMSEIEVAIRSRVTELKTKQSIAKNNENTFRTTLSLQNDSAGLITPIDPGEFSALFGDFQNIDSLIEEVTKRIIARKQAEKNIIDKVEDMLRCIVDAVENYGWIQELLQELNYPTRDANNIDSWIKYYIGGK